MKATKFLPCPSEIPLTLICDGLRIQTPLPGDLSRRIEDRYGAGIHMMFEVISREIPSLQEIGLNGIALYSTDTEPELHVFTISVQTPEGNRHLPMKKAASLLRDNGIPYARLTDLQALP